GYREDLISDKSSFEKFMTSVADVTYAALENGNRLRLGGRQRLDRAYRGLRVEDVAAVWQAQRKITQEKEATLAHFKSEQEDVHRRWQAKLEELNKQRRSGGGVSGLGRGLDNEDLKDLAGRYLDMQRGMRTSPLFRPRDPFGGMSDALTDLEYR